MSFYRQLRAVCIAGLAGLAILAIVPVAAPAQAGPLMLGNEEVLRPLQNVQLQNTNKEALFLGYKLTFRWLGLPYSVSNDGYVLGVQGKSVYYAIDKDRIVEWQAQGLLPSPLPSYNLAIADYLLGYLTWIVLALLGCFYAARAMVTRRGKPAPAQAPAPLPPSRIQQAAAGTQQQPRPAASPPATAAADRPLPSPPSAQLPQALPVANIPPPKANSIPQAKATEPPSQPQSKSDPAKLPVAKTVCRVKALKAA